MRSWTKRTVLLMGLVILGVIQGATIGQPPGQFDSGFPQDLGAIDSNSVATMRPIGSNVTNAAVSRAGTVTASASSEGMMAFASPTSSGGQMITVIDTRRNWMAVYSVDAAASGIKLLSARPLEQDFTVQFNVADPSPADIKRLQSP